MQLKHLVSNSTDKMWFLCQINNGEPYPEDWSEKWFTVQAKSKADAETKVLAMLKTIKIPRKDLFTDKDEGWTSFVRLDGEFWIINCDSTLEVYAVEEKELAVETLSKQD